MKKKKVWLYTEGVGDTIVALRDYYPEIYKQLPKYMREWTALASR